MKILFIYAYGYPDENVSSLHFTQLADELTKVGNKCEFWCNNHSRRNNDQQFTLEDEYYGIKFNRIRNVPVTNSVFRRFLNLLIFHFVVFFRILKWVRKNNYDYIITGTDPIFLHVTVSIALKLTRRKLKHLHWLLDLYPQAFVSAKIATDRSLFIKLLKLICEFSYQSMYKIYVLDAAMSRRLSPHLKKKLEYLYPWSLLSDVEAKYCSDTVNKIRSLDGTDNKISIMLSGNFGMAHKSEKVFFALKSLSLNPNVKLIVSVGGSKSDSLYEFLDKHSVDYIRKGYVPIDELSNHLNASDIHVTAIAENWDGVVLPSKFFASLQLGKPTIYIGPSGTLIKDWIDDYDIGWDYDSNSENLVDRLSELSKSELDAYKVNCKKLYREKVSREGQILEMWVKISNVQ